MDLRRLGPADSDLWRDIRLEALKRAPEQFSSSFADWAERPLADFAGRLESASVWAVIEAGRAVAVAALTPDDEARALGWVESVYVRPEARGRGLAQAVVARIERAGRERGYQELRLEVRAANPAARGLYARMGFHDVAGAGASCAGKCEIMMAKAL
ncbi:GNAT family N-acetyltransferase [Frigidibacter sp. RF13]|uniref:GNAT family N-acetyltransferase n=1 Tax=Frigidibacter sp. RF13 TaxID=2997340 RepID=UPI00226F883A|nr:GNAT family N-acetyltransferase [Frigidibacter sp. RF13]MCY1128582.1 GNAT family N-acetyltransferase [Frigidibacter sp. RF13]